MSVTYEQYRQLKGTNAPTTAGILELMGVGAEFYWSGKDDSLHRRDAFSPPLILEKANATVSFAATTRGIEGVSVQDIIAISRRQRSLIYSEMTDAASYIKRMVYAKACRLSFNCFCPMLFCAVHRLHRIAVGAADEDAYIGNVHAIEFVGKQSQKRKAIYEAAEQLIDEEMLILEYPPPPEVAAHTHRVLEHTFARREGIVRGRLDSELFERRSQSVSERVNLCKRFLNGDLTMPTVVHHEVGCCTDAEGHFSRAACVQNVANAVQQSGLLGGDLQGDVSKNRWGTAAEAESYQAAGYMFHQLQPRCYERAFQSWFDGDPGEGSDDYRKYVRGKVYRSVRVMTEDFYGAEKCVRSWIMEPIDHLWMKIQFMDEQGNSILDICYDRTNPLKVCHAKYDAIFSSTIDEGPLRTLFDHFKGADDSVISHMLTYGRQVGLSISSHVRYIYIYICISYNMLICFKYIVCHIYG